jgi:hypothetical protein
MYHKPKFSDECRYILINVLTLASKVLPTTSTIPQQMPMYLLETDHGSHSLYDLQLTEEFPWEYSPLKIPINISFSNNQKLFSIV